MSFLNRCYFGLSLLCPKSSLVSGARSLHGKGPEIARNLQQKLAELEAYQKDPSLYYRVNIGLPRLRPSRSAELKERLAIRRNLRSSKELEKSMRSPAYKVPLEAVRAQWLETAGQFHLRDVADHFGIFQDLFGEGFFVPRVPLEVRYNLEENAFMPVYSGNLVKPKEAATTPSVAFRADPDTLWSLVLTNPDGHFTEKDAEYLHWFIGNIPGNDITKGDVIMDYLQPFPAKGTGYQRMIFVLYKQEHKIDFSEYSKPTPCLTLSDRSFRTLDFYTRFQDHLTPAGLAFYQTSWDSSLTKFFHDTLDMKEPIFEYDFPAPYCKPQKWFPKKEPFNTYMDKYRDPKQIAKELLVKKLKKVDPFQPLEQEFQFPHALPEDKSMPSWQRLELQKERLKWGRYSDL